MDIYVSHGKSQWAYNRKNKGIVLVIVLLFLLIFSLLALQLTQSIQQEIRMNHDFMHYQHLRTFSIKELSMLEKSADRYVNCFIKPCYGHIKKFSFDFQFTVLAKQNCLRYMRIILNAYDTREKLSMASLTVYPMPKEPKCTFLATPQRQSWEILN